MLSALSQIFLLLWKNILLRYRHPSILLLELVWPVALVGLLSLMREGIPPIKYKDCQYPARAMPSVGVTSFLQGFICNLDNHCFTSQTTLSLTEQTTKNFEALTRDVAPYFGSNETIEILSFSDKSAGLFTPLKKVVQDDQLMTGLANLTLVSNYFRDPSVIVNILANEFKILTRAQATALMNSKIKIGMLLNLTGAPDLKGIVCDPKLLGSYLLFPDGTDVSRISAALCAVGDTKVSNLTNAILQNMNVTSFIYAVQLLEDIKEKFGDKDAMNLVFGDVAQMFETIMASKTVVGLIGSIASIKNVSEIIRSIPSWIVGLNDFNSAISLIKNIVGSLDPVMASLHLQNTSAWMAIKNIAQLGINFIELGEGKWNGTTKEFMAPITELMSDLKDLAGEESGKILFGTMDLLSKIDLIGIYDQLYKTGTLTESTTINMLSNFQELMETLSCWPTVQKMVVLVQHTADIMSVFTEKSLELKQALKQLLHSNQVLVQQLNRIFTYGPVVTRAVLQEVMDKTLLTDVIKTGNTYSTVCERIVGKIQMNPDIPANIYQDLHDILCSGEVMDAFSTLMERLHLADIALIINSTVKDIEALYNGQLFNKSVTFTAAYIHVKQFVDSVNSYRSVGYLWADLFKDVSPQSIDINQAGWEMVRDMLNTDFLTTGLLSVTKALGQVLADSSASNFMSTYIHILSHAVQLFDNTINSLTTAYQSGSPFPSAISLLTSYMSDIVRGIKYLWDNKMQSIYTLVTSADPLVTFCTGNYFGQMDFAPYVPVMEMTSLVCNTSWPLAANDFIQPVTNIIKSMTQIVEGFNSSATASYDFVSDWGDMIDHAQKILGVFSSEQLQTMDFTMGYKTFVENLDLMKFAEGFQVLFQTLQGMTVADIDKLTNLTANVMERLDSALNRYSTWEDAKLYIAIFEAFVDGEINMTKEYTTGYSSLREILDKYPPELRTFTVLLSNAYPELISALKMMILDPSKLIGKFLTGGLSAPDCKSSFVTDYLSVPANSSIHALEDFLCHLDYVTLAEKMANSQPSMQGYSQKLTALINGPVTREQINWQTLAEKIKTLILQLSSMQSLKDSNYLGFDFSPFNFTTIGLSWKEFYTAANTLKNFDINKYIPLIFQIQELALGLSKSTSTDISLDLQTYAYVSHHFLKMVNAELAFFNASSEVIVSEYLWSPELHKLFDALNKSPDLTAVFLATLQRLLVSPSQVFWPSNIESVCSDLQLFSQTFVVGVSMASPAALQSIVCGLNIDVMLVVEQVQNNRPSVKEFIDAMKLLSTSYTADEVSVDFKTLMSEYEMMNSLIRDLSSHPPVVKLTPDQQWMDVNVYLSLWGDFSQQLLTLGAELQIESKLLSWQSELSQLLLSTVEKISGTGPALGYINGILEVLQKHIGILKDGYDSFKSYPNVNQMLKIVQSAPKAVETVLYTVLTEPVKTKTWSSIFQSWDLFCQTPAGDFMTVPEGLNFDITDFLGRICQIDFVEMGHELAQFEAVNELNALFTTPSEENVNVSSLYNKLGLIIQSLQDYATEPNSAKEIAFAQLFNATLWEQVGSHITIWSSTSVKIFSDPEKITGLALEILKIVLGSLPQGYQSVYNQMVGITDIILGKVINIFNSTKLSEAFSEQPDLKLLAELLENLPQLYEVAVYTNLYYPEKITAKTPYFTSMEAFCANAPQDMFMVPPSSTFDLRAWFNRLCSVNETSLIEELGDYSMSKEIEKVLNNPSPETVDISSIISNFQKLMEKLNSGFSINDPLFSTDIWENAMKNVEKWILPYSALSDFLKDTPLRVLKVVTSLLENMPTSNNALNYIDAILSLIGTRVEEAQANGLPAAFTDLPSLKTILKLAEGMPDLVETLIYTTLTQPVKTANWVAAFQSFSTFCGTRVQDILVLPLGSSFDLEGYVQQICSIDIGQVATEITTFEGFRRIEAIVTGNDYNVVNTSSILEQANRIIQSLSYIYDNPSSFPALDLRIFSEAPWKTMWQRVEKWSPTAVAKYQDTNTLVSIFELVFGPLAEMSPELKSAYNKALAITGVLVDEVFMVLNSSSISEAYNSVPVLNQLFKIANQAPELLETLLYTSMFHPDKLSSRAVALVSLESFCRTDPLEMFSLPPGSTFDLKTWISDLCHLNFSQVEEQLASYKTANNLENIINGAPNHNTNLMTIMDKVDKIVQKLQNGVSLTEQFLNASLWTQVISRLQRWVGDYTLFNSPLMYLDGIFELIGSLSERPDTAAQLKPLLYVGVVADNLLDAVLSLENKSSIGAVDLVGRWTAMQKLLEFIQMPYVIDVFISSITSENFLTLFYNRSALEDFCNPSTSASKYLVVPKSRIIDLQEIKTAFCAIDMNNFMDQFDTFFDIQKLERVVEGTEKLDWSKLQEKFRRMIFLITDKWLKDPPHVDLPQQLMDMSYWEHLLQDSIQPLQDGLMTKYQLESIIRQLGPLLEMDEFKQAGAILNSLLDIINENLVALQVNTLTFGNVLEKIPAVSSVFSALGLDQRTLEAVMFAPVNNLTKLVELLLSDTRKQDFCAVDPWREILQLPSSFSTSGLFAAVCQDNVAPMLDKLQENYNLQTMLEALGHNPVQSQDWGKVVEKVYAIIDNIKALMSSPPMINTDAVLEKLAVSYTNTTGLWSMLKAYNTLQQAFINDATFTKSFSGVLRVSSVLLDLLNELMARTKLQNRQLDLASLFSDVPEFVAVVNGVLDVKPDPVSGLFAVQLKPAEVDMFIQIIQSPTQMVQLACNNTKFNQIFQVREDVNITSLLHVLCGLDFGPISEKLKETFRVNSLGNEVMAAWNAGTVLDVEIFAGQVQLTLEHITNLTKIDSIFFKDHDLGDILRVNVTRLLEELNSQFTNIQGAVSADYLPFSVSILNQLLHDMQNLTEIKSLTAALKFTQAYLNSFNTFLKSIQDVPISVAALLNNTEIGRILNPILNDPHILDGLVHSTLDVRELYYLVTNPFADAAVCGDQLWEAFQMPEDEARLLYQVQQSACTANQSFLLWQTVMMQANGFLLYKQLEYIQQEMDLAQGSLNVSGVADEMTQAISLIENIIKQYQNGSRQVFDLINVQGFQEVLNAVQKSIAQKLMDSSKNWSISIAELVLPQIMDDISLQSYAKTVNTANLFMSVIIGKLQRIRNGTISLSSLLTDADGLSNMIETYVRLGKTVAQAWIDGQFQIPKLLQIFTNSTRLELLCKQPDQLSAELGATYPPGQAVSDLSTLVCSVLTESLQREVLNFVSYDYIQNQLTTIWTANTTSPNYEKFISNVEEFTNTITDLANKSLTVSNSLTGSFNFSLDAFKNIATNPQLIIRLMKLFGIALEGPLHQAQDVVQALSGINTFAIMPVVNILDALKAKGITLQTIANNPETLLEVLSTLVDMDVQFSVMETVWLKPQLNYLLTHRENCNNTMYEETLLTRGVADLKLPVPWQQVYSVLCQSQDAGVMLQKMKEMGLTYIQITVLLNNMFPADQAETLDQMYDQNFGWIDLMSSIEKLTSLATQAPVNQSQVTSIKLAWEAIQDTVFDKSLNSLFSYLHLLESESGTSDGWIKFRQFLQFFNASISFIDENLSKFGQGVELKDILPNTDKVSSIIEELFGGSAAELLATSINPILFYRITLRESWAEMCDGYHTLEAYFDFPTGTDVALVQSNLCRAVLSNSTSFQMLLQLFNAGEMLVELDKLIHGDYSDAALNTSVWEAAYSSIKHLIDTAQGLQNVDTTTGLSWLTTVANKLSSLLGSESYRLTGMCNSLVRYLNNTDGYYGSEQSLSIAITALNLVTDLSKLIPELDELACILVSNNEVNIAGLIDRITYLGFFDDIKKAIDSLYEPSGAVDCVAPVYDIMRLMERINHTLTYSEVNGGQMSECLTMASGNFKDMLGSFSKTLMFTKDLLGFMQKPAVQSMLADPRINPIMDFIIDSINSTEKVVLTFADLLQDGSIASDFLINKQGIPSSIADAFLNATVSKDWIHFLHNPVTVISEYLCSVPKLSDIISLSPGSSTTISNISRALCHLSATEIAGFLQNISQPINSINNMASSKDNQVMDVITEIVPEIADIFLKFSDVIGLSVNFFSYFNMDLLKRNVFSIDKLLLSDTISSLANSFQKIMDGLKNIIPKTPDTENVLKDVQVVLNGVFGLDIVRIALLQQTHVKELLNDPQAVESYLKTLGFSEDIIQALLDAVYSSRVLFNLVSKPAHSCVDVLSMLIFVNSTVEDKQSIVTSLCRLNTTQIQELVARLIPEVNAGDLISKYVNNTGNFILESVNMTSAQLKSMVTQVDKGLSNLQKASTILQENSNSKMMMNIFTNATASASTNLDKMATRICGRDLASILSFPSNPAFALSAGSGIEEQLEQGTGDQETDLPNEFCLSFYQVIRESSLGSLIWAYVKPILRGKILYTPDNPATRAILAKANKTFSDIEELNRISKLWATKADGLQSLLDLANDTEDLRHAMDNDFIKSIVEASSGLTSAALTSSLDALQSNSIDASQLNALKTAAEVISNYSSCILTNRFQPVASEQELEEQAFRLSQTRNYLAGIVFLNLNETDTTQGRKRRQAGDIHITKHVAYKIRMDVDNVMDTNFIKSYIWKMAAESNFIEDLRYLRGFIYLQDIIDKAIIDTHKDQSVTTPGFNIKQMPYPCHHEDNFIVMLGAYMIPVVMTFVFITSIGVATHNLVCDRENGQEENLRVMGMISGLNFLAWLASTMVLLTVVCVVIAIMLYYTNIFIYSNMLIIFLYLVDFCFSSVMLLYLVSSFFTRTTMAILFVMVFFMIAYIPYVIVIGLGLTMTYWQKMLTSFASTTAFCFGSLRLSYLEENGIGVQWSNVNEYYGTDLTMSWSCYMMLIDSAIYFLIGWYVRNVMPGQYGIPQPFYFPFLPSYWFGCTQPTKAISQDAGSYQPGPLFEAPPVGFNVGISIVNLCKTYSNKKQALRNLSLNMYENQITTLLGHNGAAKTTTMKLICGVLKPTSGEVLINGKKTGCFSSSLGVCPQQNALFLHMTVREHMSFYAGIKGSKNKIETLKETRSLLQDVDLWHARNVTARNLSYGMKRRLCVALAFVGGSKTVILDEPTSGVDPHARKHIWNLITKNRPGRTILLSTHHLDEADFLSDRIAVMHQGRLLSCGSPSFLKWSVGEGFNLTLVKKANVSMIEGAQPEMNEQSAHNSVVLTFIQSMCPKASLIEQIGSELTFNLPRDPTSMQVPFDEFFRKLDLNLNQLNVDSYGLSDTTLEDVFFKLTEEADSANQSNVSSPAIISKHRRSPLEFDDLDDIGNSTESVSKQERLTGLSLLFTQMAALLIKRLHHYRRNWRILVSALLLPIIFLVFGLGFASVRLDESNMKALVLDASMYGPDSYAFFQDSVKNNISKRFVQTLTNTEVGFGTACMKDDLSRKFFDEDKCASPSPWYNYTKPMFMVGCRNAHQIFTKMPLPYVINERRMPPGEYLQDLSQWNILSYLLRTFDEYKEHRFGGWSFESADVGSATAVDPHVWFTTKGYHAMPSYFNSLSNTVLRSQLPAGEDPREYGITTINHPIRLGRAPLSVKNLVGEASDAGLAVVIVVAYSFIPCGIILYIINEKVFKERQLQSISGIGVVVYWTVAFFWDLILYSVSAAIGIAVVVIFQKDSFVIRDNLAAFSSILLLYGWANIPSLYCVGRLFNKGSTAYLVLFCLNLFLALCTIISLLVMLLYREVEVVVQIYNVCKHLYLIFPQYALGQGLMDLASNTVIYKLFMRFGDDRYKNPFSFDVIGWKLVALGIEGLFFFILTLLLDGLSWPALRVPGNRRKADYDYEDEDVARERDRILHGSNNDMLIVDNLSKVYRRNWRKFLAVNHISFGVPEGECFGLLGVNGAGKTTTFRMLTGDNKASGGSVMLKGERMTSNQHFGQNVGYCPQEGGLDEYLTAEEMLYFHARLRGFKTEQRKILVNDLLTKLCLTQYAHKAIHTYSGGTKRKLALAVALLGNPPIVYLDEPTTGMDVGTRRQAWRCIAQANRNGQSVVLTSHSMDECDALCSTIAIMVNGVIKCIGSPQHLKHKYGDGYTVIIHTGEDQLHTVTQNFLFKFPGSVIKAIHHSSVELRVPQPMCVVADILGYLQHARDDKAIEYYSLSQTTLDSVFISFAQEQTDNYVLDSSLSEDSSSEDSLSKDPTPQEFVNSAFTDDNQAVPNFYATNLQLAGDPEVYVSKL